MTPPDLQQAREVILQRTGIVIKDHQQDNLTDTLYCAMERFAMPSITALLDHLQVCPLSDPTMEFFISRITTGESYFFRDEEQIEFLRQVWLPQVVAAKRQAKTPFLRIWTAGCSSGQETVTLAILLREAIPNLDQWQIHLLGTDINVEALQQAMAGHYTEWSFRTTPDVYRHRYFLPIGKEWRVRDEVRSLMKFTCLNLIEDAYPTSLGQTQAMDLILCRNVFIYFNAETITKIATKLAECLVPGGYLITGAADMLQNTIQGCTIHPHGRYVYYRREFPVVSKNQAPLVTPYETWSPSQLRVVMPLEATFKTKKDLSGHETSRFIQTDDLEQQIVRLMGSESWHQALEIIQMLPHYRQKSAKLLQYQAKILANMGRTDQTLALCQSSIALESTDKHVYLIQGLALLEARQMAEAEAAFRKAIFLDRTFLECHFQLGLLLLQTNRVAHGLKSLENALNLAEKSPSHWLIHNASNTTVARFAPVLRAEISLYAKRL
ncbi:MAG: hypothetical protein H7839_16685 [Magnetococcus sp. YQC-5]